MHKAAFIYLATLREKKCKTVIEIDKVMDLFSLYHYAALHKYDTNSQFILIILIYDITKDFIKRN